MIETPKEKRIRAIKTCEARIKLLKINKLYAQCSKCVQGEIDELELYLEVMKGSKDK